MAESAIDAAAMLRGANLRVTQPRVAVLNLLADTPHIDTDSITTRARQSVSLSKQAVYNLLRTLTEAGLIRKIEPAGSLPHYELQTGDNHQHLVCRECGAMADVMLVADDEPKAIPSTTHGYTVNETEIFYWGRCPACRDTSSETSSAPSGSPS